MKKLTFHFSTPHDLLKKFCRDFARLELAVTRQDKRDVADALFDFANTAYSVKDWLKENPNGSKFSGQDVEAHIKAHAVLDACRDICNANKHYFIKNYAPITSDVYASATAASTLALPALSTGFQLETEQTPVFKVKVLFSDSNKFEVVDFARQAISAREAFFSRYAV